MTALENGETLVLPVSLFVLLVLAVVLVRILTTVRIRLLAKSLTELKAVAPKVDASGVAEELLNTVSRRIGSAGRSFVDTCSAHGRTYVWLLLVGSSFLLIGVALVFAFAISQALSQPEILAVDSMIALRFLDFEHFLLDLLWNYLILATILLSVWALSWLASFIVRRLLVAYRILRGQQPEEPIPPNRYNLLAANAALILPLLLIVFVFHFIDYRSELGWHLSQADKEFEAVLLDPSLAADLLVKDSNDEGETYNFKKMASAILFDQYVTRTERGERTDPQKVCEVAEQLSLEVANYVANLGYDSESTFAPVLECLQGNRTPDVDVDGLMESFLELYEASPDTQTNNGEGR